MVRVALLVLVYDAGGKASRRPVIGGGEGGAEEGFRGPRGRRRAGPAPKAQEDQHHPGGAELRQVGACQLSPALLCVLLGVVVFFMTACAPRVENLRAPPPSHCFLLRTKTSFRHNHLLREAEHILV